MCRHGSTERTPAANMKLRGHPARPIRIRSALDASILLVPPGVMSSVSPSPFPFLRCRSVSHCVRFRGFGVLRPSVHPAAPREERRAPSGGMATPPTGRRRRSRRTRNDEPTRAAAPAAPGQGGDTPTSATTRVDSSAPPGRLPAVSRSSSRVVRRRRRCSALRLLRRQKERTTTTTEEGDTTRGTGLRGSAPPADGGKSARRLVASVRSLQCGRPRRRPQADAHSLHRRARRSSDERLEPRGDVRTRCTRPYEAPNLPPAPGGWLLEQEPGGVTHSCLLLLLLLVLLAFFHRRPLRPLPCAARLRLPHSWCPHLSPGARSCVLLPSPFDLVPPRVDDGI